MKELRTVVQYVAIAYGVLGLAAFNKIGEPDLDPVVDSWMFSVMLTALSAIAACLLVMVYTLDLKNLAIKMGVPNNEWALAMVGYILLPGTLLALLLAPAFALPESYISGYSFVTAKLDRERQISEIEREFAEREIERSRERTRVILADAKADLIEAMEALDMARNPGEIIARQEIVERLQGIISSAEESLAESEAMLVEIEEKERRILEVIEREWPKQ